jgi:DNA-binding transcriptional ArsR family regulator
MSSPWPSYNGIMNTIYPIASVAELIGEPARAAVLVALLDGRSLTAGELALIANVSAQSASAHLAKMVAGGLLKARSSGRHRYYGLAGPDVAHAMEALGAIATVPRPSAAPQSQNDLEIRKARSCYDHLAGRIAVEIVNALETSKVIRISGDRDYELGRNGRRWFSNLGIDTDALRRSRRSFARQCLDWTEGRPHLAGALGAELCARTLALGWFAKQRNKRALRVTHKGTRELHARFGISA